MTRFFSDDRQARGTERFHVQPVAADAYSNALSYGLIARLAEHDSTFVVGARLRPHPRLLLRGVRLPFNLNCLVQAFVFFPFQLPNPVREPPEFIFRQIVMRNSTPDRETDAAAIQTIRDFIFAAFIAKHRVYSVICILQNRTAVYRNG